jgi:D-2-hydroxyacid dehydrogenase (NADP+)
MVSKPEGRPRVVICAPLLGRDLTPLRSFEPAIDLVDGNAAFDAFNAARQNGDASAVATARSELATLLIDSDVLCMAFPVLHEIIGLAPKLRWLHHTQAGVSNLWPTDVWQTEVLITSGRGHVRSTAMAEYAIAGAVHFARGIYDAHLDKENGRLDRSHYQLQRLAGSTMGVVGLGGIGSEVARLARALGMRAIATRRSVTHRWANAEGVDLLLPPSELNTLAAESDFVTVCTQLTEETRHLINANVISVMKPSAVIVNVSRGEVIDEAALIAALREHRLQGAVLDVYEGELSGQPPRAGLMETPGLLLTPHISTGGANSANEIMELFAENLRRYLAGEELINVVDRERGY